MGGSQPHTDVNFDKLRSEFLDTLLDHSMYPRFHEETTCEIEKKLQEMISREYKSQKDLDLAVNQLNKLQKCSCKNVNLENTRSRSAKVRSKFRAFQSVKSEPKPIVKSDAKIVASRK